MLAGNIVSEGSIKGKKAYGVSDVLRLKFFYDNSYKTEAKNTRFLSSHSVRFDVADVFVSGLGAIVIQTSKDGEEVLVKDLTKFTESGKYVITYRSDFKAYTKTIYVYNDLEYGYDTYFDNKFIWNASKDGNTYTGSNPYVRLFGKYNSNIPPLKGYIENTTTGTEIDISEYLINGDSSCIHDFTTDVTYATCTEPGKVVRTCTKCGRVETEKTSPTGHNYVAGICTDCGDRQ